MSVVPQPVADRVRHRRIAYRGVPVIRPELAGDHLSYRKPQTRRDGLTHEEGWLVDGRQVWVDGTDKGVLLEAKWTGRNSAAWGRSPYNPDSAFYDEAKILDQAQRLSTLSARLDAPGVRYVVPTAEAQQAFQSLFGEHPALNNIEVIVDPGKGM